MRKKLTFDSLIMYFALKCIENIEKDLDQKIKDQTEKERSQKLKEGSIDAEFRVIE